MVSITPPFSGESPSTGGEAIHHRRWRDVIDALMAEQATPGWAPVLAYGWGEVPGFDITEDGNGNQLEKPHQHWQIAVTRSFVDGSTMAGRQRRIGWTLETLAVAPTPGEVRAMRDRMHTLRNRQVPFGHGSVLRLIDENNIDRLPDAAAHFGALSTWSYATRP